MIERINQTHLIENQIPEHQASISHMSEQIAQSVLAKSILEEVTHLKSKDLYRHGAFVESSYFGLLGLLFKASI